MRRAMVVLVLMLARPVLAGDEPKSPATATWLSAGITAGGVVASGLVLGLQGLHSRASAWELSFALTAVAVGPSAGHIYAAGGDPAFTAGAGLRLAGGVLALTARFLGALDECGDVANDWVCTPTFQIGALSTAAALFVAGGAWDIATAGAAARRHNRAHHLTLTLQPLGPTPGLALVGTF